MLGQNVAGTITGFVQDQSSAVVPRAIVAVTNQDGEIVASYDILTLVAKKG